MAQETYEETRRGDTSGEDGCGGEDDRGGVSGGDSDEPCDEKACPKCVCHASVPWLENPDGDEYQSARSYSTRRSKSHSYERFGEVGSGFESLNRRPSSLDGDA